MNEKRYQKIVFTTDPYEWNSTKEAARAAMWADIAKQLQLLIKQNYLAVIYEDDVDIVVIQYEHNNKFTDYGIANPYWITEDEYYEAIHTNDESDEDTIF